MNPIDAMLSSPRRWAVDCEGPGARPRLERPAERGL